MLALSAFFLILVSPVDAERISETDAERGDETSAEQILKAADQFRSPVGGFEADVRVLDRDKDESIFKVFIDGNDKSLMVTQGPPRDVGRNMLMLDQDIWMFLPSVKRPVRVALRQRLMGQVAQGDISRMKWHGDYHVTLASKTSETKNGVPSLRLDLKAAKANLTYDRLTIWVSDKDYRPLVAEFLSPMGKVLKVATFDNYGPLAGQIRARTIRLQDALKPKDVSEIQIQSIKPRKFPQGFFSQTNLEKPQLR